MKALLACLLVTGGGLADTFLVGEHAFHRQTLRNGLIALALQSTNELADVYLALDVGGRHESIDTAGIAHMAEHAMFAGTAKVPPQAFEKRIRAFGGRANAFTREDYTLFYDIKIPMDQLDRVLDLEADRLVNLRFEEKAFRFEQERLKTEEAGDDRIAEQLQKQADAFLFPGHPYGTGLRENGFTKAPGLAPETVQAFYKQHYHPRNTAIVIVSRETPDRTLARIEKAFASLPAGPGRAASHAVPSSSSLRTKEARAQGLQRKRVEYLWRIPPVTAPDHHAWLLLGELLENRSRHVSQPVNVIVGNRLDGDSLRIWTTGEKAKEQLENFLQDLAKHPFSAAELDRAIQDLADDFLQLKLHSRPYFSLPATVVRYAANKHPTYVPEFDKKVRGLELEMLRKLTRTALVAGANGIITFAGSGEVRTLPDQPRALADFAADAQESGQHADAIEAYSRLLKGKLNAMYRIIYLASRGQVYLDTRDYDAAIADFEAAMKLSDYPALPPLLEEAQRLKAESMTRRVTEPAGLADTHPTKKPGELKQDLFSLIPMVNAELEAWRGLTFKTPVAVTFTNHPPGEKLGGWYNSETKQLVVSIQDDRPQFSKGVLYHELFHALQDQHFDLPRLHREAIGQDAQRALTALIEGEAMLAVSELMDYNFLAHADIRDTGPIPPATFEKKFHYGAGLRFIMYLKEHGGWPAVAEAFQHPPRSTREIYEPSRYPMPPTQDIDWPSEATDIMQTGMYDIRWLFTRPVGTRKSAIVIAASVLASSQATMNRERRWKLLFQSPGDLRRAKTLILEQDKPFPWQVDVSTPRQAKVLVLKEKR
jgi:predicted Zn-dependent peptidase